MAAGAHMTLEPFTEVDAHRFTRRFMLGIAIACGIIGIIGPRWGSPAGEGVAVGRDIILVVDLSRSMLAEDIDDRAHPTRALAALAYARGCIDEARRRGGDRIGVIVFSAKPYVIVPLTTDLDHAAARLAEIDPAVPPAEVFADREGIASGTRIGAALSAAVANQDSRFPGRQDIILFSDLDDPARDGEWESGVAFARASRIPVHVVGVGDPIRESFVVLNGEPIEGIGPDGVRSPIQSRLHEEIASQITTATSGQSIAARRGIVQWPMEYDRVFDRKRLREIEDDDRVQPRRQSHCFFAVACVAMIIASRPRICWWGRQSAGHRDPDQYPPRSS
jgi:Ca-activated chloride channel homolog